MSDYDYRRDGKESYKLACEAQRGHVFFGRDPDGLYAIARVWEGGELKELPRIPLTETTLKIALNQIARLLL